MSKFIRTGFILNMTVFLVLASASLQAKGTLDSLRNLVKNSNGDIKVEYSITLAKKLIEYSKIAEGISTAQKVLTAGKRNNNINFQLQAYAIISRGYLIGGDIEQALAYGDSTMLLARKTKEKYGLGLAYQSCGTPRVYIGDAEDALKMLDSSLAIFNKEEYPIERATSNLYIASVLATTGQAEACLPYLNEAKKIFNANNDYYKSATIDLNLALMKGSIMGQYEEAINISLKVLPYFEMVEDSLKMATCNSTIATCYDATGNYDKAIHYFKSAIKMMGENGNVLMKANFYNNLGEVYKHKNDYIHAYENYKKALDVFTQYGITEGIVVAENNIGECFLHQKKYGEALSYFQKSLDKVNKQNDYYKTAILYRNIGKVYLNTNKISDAISYFHKSIDSGNKIGITEEIFPTYKILAEAYSRIGNYQEAYKYHKLFSEVKDEFTRTSNAEKISDIDTKYQTVKKEKEIELLKKNKEIQELQIGKQRDIAIALIAATILIALFSINIFKKYRDNQKLNAALEERNRLIEEQRDELITINKELSHTNERLTASEADLKHLNATKDKFFSIVAHDLKGPFSSLLGLTEIMKDDTGSMSAEELQKISAAIHSTSKKVYELTENLLEWSRSQLDMLNIKSELFDFNELVNKNTRLYKNSLLAKQITLNKDLCKESKINTDKDMIDFTLRNLINNAIKFNKHGGEINILSSLDKEYLKVQIADTGVGIPEEAMDKLFKIDSTFSTPGTNEEKGTGLGLILASEFIKKIGGSIFVNSKVNHGTTFTFTIPLTN